MALSQSTAALRAVTFRISSTPTKQLPLIAPQIAASLWNCKDALSTSQDSLKSNGDAATLVHRFKTSLSSLLQDRSIEGRWAAVVLVKATIEAGGAEILSKSNAWVRSLLAILKKPDPPTTRNLAAILLTRIFMLTWDYSNLVRETTTPALPTFIASCLNNIERKNCSASELQTALEAFATLLPRHPTIFRTHETQIRSLVLRILSTTCSTPDTSPHYTQATVVVAQRLLVLLHHCAPKQGASEKWDDTLKTAVSASHTTCDRIFRSIVEQHASSTSDRPTTHSSALNAGDAELDSDDAVGLAGWQGVYAGSDRLVMLLRLLQRQFEPATAGAVSVRIGEVIDLLSRILNVTVPTNDYSLKFNNEIAKDERETLFQVLPGIHVAALDLITALLRRFGHSISSVIQALMELVSGTFSAEMSDMDIRRASYSTTEVMLELVGPSMTKEDVAELGDIIKACCDDLLPAAAKYTSYSTSNQGALRSKQQPPSGDLSLQNFKAQSSHPTTHSKLQNVADSLLPVLISKLNPSQMPRKLRVQIERTAVLTRNKEGLVACVINPAKKDQGAGSQPSLLPLLAREYPEIPEVESLLRPRMPPVGMDSRQGDRDEFEDEENEHDVADGTPNREVSDTSGGAAETEPTADLLNALTQNSAVNEGQHNDEDLYSASPKPDGKPSGDMDVIEEAKEEIPSTRASVKRTAPEPAGGETSAKRLQAAPVAEALTSDPAESLPGPDPISAQAALPVKVSLGPSRDGPEGSEQTATVPAAPGAGLATSNIGQSGDGGSDDSDFEIPPLTMESDTDPEEDEAAEEEDPEDR